MKGAQWWALTQRVTQCYLEFISIPLACVLGRNFRRPQNRGFGFQKTWREREIFRLKNSNKKDTE